MSILPEVKAGDLISASNWNEIVRTLNDLQTRVANLERQKPVEGSVVITSVVPAGGIGMPIRVGDDLQILGMNFGYTRGAQRVFFDTTRVDTYRLGSSDTKLIVPVPPLANPQATQSRVTLRVENGFGYDALDLTVIAPQPTLDGDVDVLWLDREDNPKPNPIVPEQAATAAFRIRSRANRTAVYKITPTIIAANGIIFPDAQILGANGVTKLVDRQIELAPNQEADIFVFIPQVPKGSDKVPFTLTVTATAEALSGSDQREITIGEKVAASDPNIILTFSKFSVEPSDGGQDTTSRFDSATNTIWLKPGTTATMSYLAKFILAGTYEVSVKLDDTLQGWEAGLGDTPEEYEEVNSNITETPYFSLLAQDATAGKTGTVTFEIHRKGALDKAQIRKYKLALLS